MLRNRLIYAAIMAAATVYFLTTWPWTSFFLFLLLLLLPLLSLLFSAFSVKKLRYELIAPRKVPRGSSIKISICDKSRTSWLAYHVELEISSTDSDAEFFTADMFCGKSSEIEITKAHCCCVRCHVKAAYACDMLGLFRFRLPVLPDIVSIVTPSPMPADSDLSAANAVCTSYRPKRGGGAAEVYEIREYQPGDSLRDIHWKLTAKTDRLMVREPQIPVGSAYVITFDLIPPSAELDRILDRIMWISEQLSARETAHIIRWICPSSGKVVSAAITDCNSFDRFLQSALGERVSSQVSSIKQIPFSDAERRIHIDGEVQK